MKHFIAFILLFTSTLSATTSVNQLEMQFRAIEKYYEPAVSFYVTFDAAHAQRDAHIAEWVKNHSGTALQKKYTQQNLNIRYADEVVKQDRSTIQHMQQQVEQKLHRCTKYKKLHPDKPGYVTSDEVQRLEKLREALAKQEQFLDKLYMMLKQSVNV